MGKWGSGELVGQGGEVELEGGGVEELQVQGEMGAAQAILSSSGLHCPACQFMEKWWKLR